MNGEFNGLTVKRRGIAWQSDIVAARNLRPIGLGMGKDAQSVIAGLYETRDCLAGGGIDVLIRILLEVRLDAPGKPVIFPPGGSDAKTHVAANWQRCIDVRSIRADLKDIGLPR